MPYCQKFSFRYISDADFRQAAKTGGRRTPVTFGRQPTQVFGRPCQSTKCVIALRRNFWLERLTEEKECRKLYETRPPGWEYYLNLMLTFQICCLEPVLNIRAQACSEAFWRLRESHSMTSWCLGRSLHCQSCRWKGRSLNCPETRWREVEDSLQSRRVTSCTTGEACLTKTSTERTTESRRQSYRRQGGEVSCDSEEVQLSQRLTDGVEAGLRQLATDCLRVFRYSFVAFNLAESVSLCILFWVI